MPGNRGQECIAGPESNLMDILCVFTHACTRGHLASFILSFGGTAAKKKKKKVGGPASFSSYVTRTVASFFSLSLPSQSSRGPSLRMRWKRD